MRELHAWHGDRRDGVDAPAESRLPHAGDRHRPEARLDVEARVARALEYRKAVEEAYAMFESKDQPADGIARRSIPEQKEVIRQAKPERSWLPSNETAQLVASIGGLASVVANALNYMPAKMDAIAASTLAAVVTGVAWGNKHWKDKNGDRPEG